MVNIKTILLGLIIITILTTGCINSDDVNFEKPSNLETIVFQKDFTKIPSGENISYLGTGRNITYAPYNQYGLELSDVIFYGTVKEIQPSFWTTADKREPNLTYFVNNEGRKNAGSDGEEIYTDIVFTVNEIVKGNSSKEMTVRFFSGQVNDVVYSNASWPSPWDVEIGDQYLLYLTKQTDYYELTAVNGIEPVIKEKE
ncbi:hypothetical protein MmiHf6_08800 [Methanimicrococcus hongohii]|uniref:Uncharacterized protein n=1 Tax=Methanimicrococcus hongohii TaxID=3028295 RepID=A0AA96ZTT5_9EURY|nr:hypothetical protein [Methanimicrococcus sp. Hf6]WNY23571.1 hypothetical protein MmiHf6_08800 [Methanimicrococcus sp. Hf6]